MGKIIDYLVCWFYKFQKRNYIMAYEYSYDKKYNTKPVIIIAVSAVLIFLFYFITSNTAYVSYTESLESELNKTKASLEAAENGKTQCLKDLFEKIGASDRCNSELSEKASDFANCDADRSGMMSYINTVNSSLSNCMGERQGLQSLYANESENFRVLVRNSAASICCSFRDAQRGSVINWGIANNSMVCEGMPNDASSMRLSTYTVNCSTGATSY